MTTWYKGPPPSIGWWPASTLLNPKLLRWWDGKWWSLAVVPGTPANEAGEWAKLRAPRQDDIAWTDRPASWPERSRT